MNTAVLTETLVSQYLASLAMLREAIASMPSPMWNDPSFENRSWRIAYHALFYTHLYLSASERAFTPWAHAVDNAEVIGRRGHPPFDVPVVTETLSIDDVLKYHNLVSAMVQPAVESLSLDGPSGFEWIPLSRLELHIYNIRHVQHHAAQLIERRRAAGAPGVDWIGMNRPETLP